MFALCLNAHQEDECVAKANSPKTHKNQPEQIKTWVISLSPSVLETLLLIIIKPQEASLLFHWVRAYYLNVLHMLNHD